MKINTIFGWIGAVASVVAIIGGLYAGYKFLAQEKKLEISHFIGEYSGSAEGNKFTLGITSVGGGQIIGEVNYGTWDYVDVQLHGYYDKDQEVVNLEYRRNEKNPSGPDEGIAKITFDKKTKIYKGYWTSTKIPGNEEPWILKKTNEQYRIRGWDG